MIETTDTQNSQKEKIAVTVEQAKKWINRNPKRGEDESYEDYKSRLKYIKWIDSMAFTFYPSHKGGNPYVKEV